jgi:Family of unknown function (DUF6173)
MKNIGKILGEIEDSKREAKKIENGFAEIIHERLMNQISKFENTLDSEHEIAAMLASFGKEIVIQIESVKYSNPYLIIFHGVNEADGSRVELVQHVTQINVLFVPIKVNGNRLPNRIGF